MGKFNLSKYIEKEVEKRLKTKYEPQEAEAQSAYKERQELEEKLNNIVREAAKSMIDLINSSKHSRAIESNLCNIRVYANDFIAYKPEEWRWRHERLQKEVKENTDRILFEITVGEVQKEKIEELLNKIH